MIKKIICLGVVLVMCLGFFSGCNSGIWHKVAYNDQGGFGFNETEQLYFFSEPALIISFEEIKALCEEWKNPAFQEIDENNSSQISQLIRSYDEKFFEKKALIIYSFEGNESIKISNVKVDEKQLIVKLGKKRGTFNDIAITWLFIIEVKKADIEGVTTVKVEKKY